MNKAELLEKAKSLKIDVNETSTNKEIEAAIAEKEQDMVITSKDGQNAEVEGKGEAKVEAKAKAPNRAQEPNRAVIEDKSDEAKKPTEKENGVVVKYLGESASFQIGRYKFSDKEPFVVVSKEFADTIDKDNPDLKISSKKELDEFYAE